MTIAERLQAGERLVLDGGTGSELQRRGVDVLEQVAVSLKAWSATANLTSADVVQQVHQDYLRVGADIITSNNFWTSPTRLATVAAETALRARDAAAPERPHGGPHVAGGIAAPALQDRERGDLASDVQRLGRQAFSRARGRTSSRLRPTAPRGSPSSPPTGRRSARRSSAAAARPDRSTSPRFAASSPTPTADGSRAARARTPLLSLTPASGPGVGGRVDGHANLHTQRQFSRYRARQRRRGSSRARTRSRRL